MFNIYKRVELGVGLYTHQDRACSAELLPRGGRVVGSVQLMPIPGHR